MPTKPTILNRKQLVKTKVFCVEELSLEFSNGENRTYERLVSSGSGAVMIVPLTANNEFVLIKEYSAGTHDYQLVFPKGLIEPEEAVLNAANRELKEEVGFGASELTQLKSMTLAPGYLTHTMNLVLAKKLYPEKLEGDEPETLEVVFWPISKVGELLEQPDFTEARSIAALLMVERLLK